MMLLGFAAAGFAAAKPPRTAAPAGRARQPALTSTLSKEDEMRTMGPGDMVDAVCRGLMDNDRSADDEGFSRLYAFMTPQGRTYMAPPPPRSGRLDGVSLEFFTDNACDPVFGLVGCDYYTIVETSSVPATVTRGGLGTCKVRFESGLNRYLDSQRCTRSDGSSSVGRGAARVALGTGDKALQTLVDAEEEEEAAAAAAGRELRQGRQGGEGVEAQEPMSGLASEREAAAKTRQVQSRTLLFGLEQQRRPPLEGVWLIKEVLPLEQTLFQVINKGSTEDW
jgi:hypothetical protein